MNQNIHTPSLSLRDGIRQVRNVYIDRGHFLTDHA
jgi:hypothetical protein